MNFHDESSGSPHEPNTVEKFRTSREQTSGEQTSSARLAFELLTDHQVEKLVLKKTSEHKESSEFSSVKKNAFSDFDEPNSSVKNSLVDECCTAREILRALHILVNQECSNLCTQIELLVRFDELEGWRDSGSKSCAAWMNAYLHIDRRTAWERLRVGRQIRSLPVIKKLFQSGSLSWSKVRLLTRVASAENERQLANASIDASVSDVQRICEEYRWAPESSESDAYRAKVQYERRALVWQQLPDGNTQIRIVLPPDQAQNFLHAVEQCEDLIYQEETLDKHIDCNSTATDSNADSITDNKVAENSPESSITPSQRRADAVVLLAERSIAFQGEHQSPADRFQVVLNIDNDSLNNGFDQEVATHDTPCRKPMIEGIGSVPIATARKIACDCSILKLLTEDGEPLSIGRKSRIWTPPMRRALLTRDRHCQFPGCTSHRFLQIHHIKHWVDGGETSIDNGVCLCQFHHQLVHSENYMIKRIVIKTNEFETTGIYSTSKRKLLPTRCRFEFERLINKPDNNISRKSAAEENPRRGDSWNYSTANSAGSAGSAGSADGSFNWPLSDDFPLDDFLHRTKTEPLSSYEKSFFKSRNEVKNRCDEHQATYLKTNKLDVWLGRLEHV